MTEYKYRCVEAGGYVELSRTTVGMAVQVAVVTGLEDGAADVVWGGLEFAEVLRAAREEPS